MAFWLLKFYRLNSISTYNLFSNFFQGEKKISGTLPVGTIEIKHYKKDNQKRKHYGVHQGMLNCFG